MIDNLTSERDKVFVFLSNWISRQLTPEQSSWLRQQQQIASDSSGRAFFLLIVPCLVL